MIMVLSVPLFGILTLYQQYSQKCRIHVGFSDTWKETDGGHFETYESNEAKEPVGTHDLWLPKRNSFNFFKVTQRSHHQVREILTNVKTRRSLTGWFHTRDQLPPRMPLEVVEPKYVKKEFNVQQCTIFNEWINPLYLGLESMGRIQVKTNHWSVTDSLFSDPV